jgi:hypothetical protein
MRVLPRLPTTTSTKSGSPTRRRYADRWAEVASASTGPMSVSDGKPAARRPGRRLSPTIAAKAEWSRTADEIAADRRRPRLRRRSDGGAEGPDRRRSVRPNIDCRQDGARIDPTQRASWLFNATIGGIDQADAILLIGTNPRLEATVLNAPGIRKRYLHGNVRRSPCIGDRRRPDLPLSSISAPDAGLIQRELADGNPSGLRRQA